MSRTLRTSRSPGVRHVREPDRMEEDERTHGNANEDDENSDEGDENPGEAARRGEAKDGKARGHLHPHDQGDSGPGEGEDRGDGKSPRQHRDRLPRSHARGPGASWGDGSRSAGER